MNVDMSRQWNPTNRFNAIVDTATAIIIGFNCVS